MNDAPCLARKVNRAKWEHRHGLANDEIPADAVTADLRTIDNRLSFWRCESLSDDGIRQTVLALAAAAQRIDPMDLVWIEESILHERHISMNQTDGRTPVVSLRSRHVDVIGLDLGRLTTVATLLAEAMDNHQHRRLTKKEIVAIVAEAIQDDLVSVDKLDPKVRDAVEKSGVLR